MDDLIDRLVRPVPAKTDDRSNLRFAVYNAQLHDAELRFDDRPAGRVHSVTAWTPAGAVEFAIRALDVTPYLAYMPSALPVRIESGVLSANLALALSAPSSGAPTFKVEGSALMQDVRLSDATGAPLASWRKADVALRRAELFTRRVELASLRVGGADLYLRRAADGAIGLPGHSAQAPLTTPAEPPAPAMSRPLLQRGNSHSTVSSRQDQRRTCRHRSSE